MSEPTVGHRQRLRQRFLASGSGASDGDIRFSQLELLELLLSYAIPRQDVAPLARSLIAQFGSLSQVLAASYDDLTAIPGIGEHTAVLIGLVARMAEYENLPIEPLSSPTDQPALFELETGDEDKTARSSEPDKSPIRTFTNDLSAAALEYLPQIVDFPSIEDYQAFLEQALPYNSFNSRKRYARNLINRYYPTNDLQTSLTELFSYQPATDAIKAALLYETARAEPAVRFVAEEIVWPAVPLGVVTRDQLKQRLQDTFAQVSAATISRMVYSLLNLYTILNDAQSDENTLHIQIHTGSPGAFVYVLAAEFPEPGMYPFESLEGGPMRRWLLWDREWIRRQLYNLRDLGILSKVSEIDAMRQFTLRFRQRDTLRRYFEHPDRETLALREGSVAETSETLGTTKTGGAW
jgi:hypothetical protein